MQRTHFRSQGLGSPPLSPSPLLPYFLLLEKSHRSKLSSLFPVIPPQARISQVSIPVTISEHLSLPLLGLTNLYHMKLPKILILHSIFLWLLKKQSPEICSYLSVQISVSQTIILSSLWISSSISIQFISERSKVWAPTEQGSSLLAQQIFLK